jgi:HEAT repeat protein
MWKSLHKKDVNGLIKALNYKDSAMIRGKAAQMLGELGGEEAVKALIIALGDVDARVRTDAASAIGWLKDERTIEPLIALLRDEDDTVRHFANIALASFKDVRIVEPLLTMVDVYGAELYKYKHDLMAVNGAIQNVGNKAIEPLKSALLHANAKVRAVAALSLQKLMWKPSQDIVGASYYAALKLWDPLADLGALAIEPLSWCLKSTDADERAQAVHCLGQIGSESAVSFLPPMLDDKDKIVRLMALEVLEGIGNPAYRERVSNASRELSGYREEQQLKLQGEQAHQRKVAADHRKELIRNSICKVKFNNGRASLEPGDGKLSLVDLFLQDEPAIVYELDEVKGKLDDFPWSSYPVAVNFGARRNKDISIRNFFRCSGTFFYKGETGIVDKRPRIYFVTTNIHGVLVLNGAIEYEEDSEHGPFSKDLVIVHERKKSVYELANYGIVDGKFDEVLRDSVYTIRLLDIEIDKVLSKFERHGTMFYSFNVKHIIREDNDDVKFRGQVRMRNEV